MVKQRKTKNHRRNRRTSRKMRGGFIQLNGSNVGNTSMNSASNLSLAQGTNYGSVHKEQHGGQNMGSMGTNMGTNMGSMGTNMGSMGTNMGSMGTNMGSMGTNMGSMNMGRNMSLPPMNSTSAVQMGGVAPLGEQGLLDDSLRTSAHLAPLDRSFAEIAGMSDQAGGRRRRRARKSRGRKSRGRKSRRNYSMRGGVADVTSPTTLLTGDALKGAVEGMNPEWKLVEDASAFNPRM